jgi:hypothetical protein
MDMTDGQSTVHGQGPWTCRMDNRMDTMSPPHTRVPMIRTCPNMS